jgi:hypothetical protein
LLAAEDFIDVALGQTAVLFWAGFEQENQSQPKAIVGVGRVKGL